MQGLDRLQPSLGGVTLVEGIWQLHCGRRNLRYNGDRVTQLVARCGWPDAFAQLVASQSSTSSQQSNSTAALLSCTLRRSNGFLISKTCRLSGTNVLCFCNALKAHISSKNGVSEKLVTTLPALLDAIGTFSLCLWLGLCVLGGVFWVCISISSYTVHANAVFKISLLPTLKVLVDTLCATVACAEARFCQCCHLCTNFYLQC